MHISIIFRMLASVVHTRECILTRARCVLFVCFCFHEICTHLTQILQQQQQLPEPRKQNIQEENAHILISAVFSLVFDDMEREFSLKAS